MKKRLIKGLNLITKLNEINNQYDVINKLKGNLLNIEYYEDIQTKNKVRQNYEEVLNNLAEYICFSIIEPIIKSINNVIASFEMISKTKDKEEIAKYIYESINLKNVTSDQLRKNIIVSVNNFIYSINEMYEDIFNEFIPVSLHNKKVKIERKEMDSLIDNTSTILSEVNSDILYIQDIQKEMICLFPEYKSVMNKTFCEGFLDGIRCGLYAVIFCSGEFKSIVPLYKSFSKLCKEDNVISKFNEMFFEKYAYALANVYNLLDEKIYDELCIVFKNVIASHMNKFELILDEFDKYSISINKLDTEILEVLKVQNSYKELVENEIIL